MTAELAGNQIIVEILYLVASVLFILSLKWMSSPTTARHGIWAGEAGMVLAICGTLLHHGMLIVGVPYTEPALFDTRTGGSPYGATHLATAWNTALSKDEIAVAHALGARVARIAMRLREAS